MFGHSLVALCWTFSIILKYLSPNNGSKLELHIPDAALLVTHGATCKFCVKKCETISLNYNFDTNCTHNCIFQKTITVISYFVIYWGNFRICMQLKYPNVRTLIFSWFQIAPSICYYGTKILENYVNIMPLI